MRSEAAAAAERFVEAQLSTASIPSYGEFELPLRRGAARPARKSQIHKICVLQDCTLTPAQKRGFTLGGFSFLLWGRHNCTDSHVYVGVSVCLATQARHLAILL